MKKNVPRVVLILSCPFSTTSGNVLRVATTPSLRTQVPLCLNTCVLLFYLRFTFLFAFYFFICVLPFYLSFQLYFSLFSFFNLFPFLICVFFFYFCYYDNYRAVNAEDGDGWIPDAAVTACKFSLTKKRTSNHSTRDLLGFHLNCCDTSVSFKFSGF